MVFVASNAAPKSRIFIKNCYFVNMIGQGCRRNNGGFYDNATCNTDTMWVENSTHVWVQGMMYKFSDNQVGKVFFNHNTFINIGNDVFGNCGYLSNYSVTNNIFVNCQVQPYYPGLDVSEKDYDGLPTGIINVDTLLPSHEPMDRKVFVYANFVYWDPRLAGIEDDANELAINGHTDWVSSMILMNSRTQAMFDDDVKLPVINRG